MGSGASVNHNSERRRAFLLDAESPALLTTLGYLCPPDISSCARVCKSWSMATMHEAVWEEVYCWAFGPPLCSASSDNAVRGGTV